MLGWIVGCADGSFVARTDRWLLGWIVGCLKRTVYVGAIVVAVSWVEVLALLRSLLGSSSALL